MALLPAFVTSVGVVAGLLYTFYKVFQDTIFIGKIRCVYELVTMLMVLKGHSKKYHNKVWSYVDDFEEKVDKGPDVTQFIFVENDEHVTRQALDKRANQIGNWISGEKVGMKQKDTIAFMMLNRPDYVAFWLGVAKVGGCTALLNTNVTGKALVHSVSVAVEQSKSKILVVDGELRDQIAEDVKELKGKGVTIYYWDEVSKVVDACSDKRPDKSKRSEVYERDPLLYIYTSGTTGLPKAGKISQTRFYLGALPVGVMCYMKPGVRLYTCLPLYHSAAGMMGVGGVLRTGGTMVVR
jgi:fatty-acyl-CoA synthase